MKIRFFDFEYMHRGIPAKSKCTVKILPATDKSELIIKEIGFSHPVLVLSYAQLQDITQQVQNAIDKEYVPNVETALTILPQPQGVVIKKDSFIGRLYLKVVNMIIEKEKKGELSKTEKTKIKQTFDLVHFFLGGK